MIETIRTQGYHIERGLFSKAECGQILRSLDSVQHQPPLVWNKGWATTCQAWSTLAKNDKIVDKVSELIGEDVILWGAIKLVRIPGQIHQWHDDVESSTQGEGFISLWMGIENTTEETSLKVIPGSHQYNKLLFQIAFEKGLDWNEIEDEQVSAWSRELNPDSGIQGLDTRDGDALFFD